MLTEAERKIVRELIRNPRSSDNQIAKKTHVPVMTVNRKRKRLEEEGLIHYYASLDKGEEGVGIFGARELFTITFELGISKKDYMEKLESDERWRFLNSQHISFVYLGENEGHLALILALDAVRHRDLVDEFNGKIVPYLRRKLGNSCIKKVETVQLTKQIRVHHNYLPKQNMEHGVIRSDWPDDLIFVDEVDKRLQEGSTTQNL